MPFWLVVLFCWGACKGPESRGSDPGKLHQAPSFAIREDSVVPRRKYTVFPQIHAHFAGRVSEFVWVMLEDGRGHFWFGTNHNGLIGYNGDSLVQYLPEDGVGGSAVRDLVEDVEGNLWLGTSDGLTRFDGQNFVRLGVAEGLPGAEIWSLEVDRNGVLWIGTVDGLAKYDGKTFSRVPVPRAKVEGARPMLSEERISQVVEDRQGRLWLVTDGFGITVKDGTAFTHLTTAEGLPDNHVTQVFEDRQGHVWVGTFGGGVARYDGTSFENFTQQGLVKGEEVRNFCQDTAGNVWFAVENEGVYRYDGTEFTRFTTEDGLTTNGVQCTYADRQGRVWFGTWSGLSVYDGERIRDAGEVEAWVR